MAFRRRFAARLIGRTVALILAATLAAWLAIWGRAPTAVLLLAALAGAAALAIYGLVNESNAELARFVTALERGDLTQSFGRTGHGAGFDRLGAAYDLALARVRGERAKSARVVRFAEVLVDIAPTALLVIDADDQVSLANKAARRLLRRSAACPIAELAPFGPSLVAALRSARPGPTRLAHLISDGLSQRITLDTTLMEHGGATRRIVAIKVIQAELDSAELMAQVDLVRVLTHEIMNSLTPVTSLAGTATRLTAALDPALAPGIADAQLATAALARRALELERFVDSYKGFSEAPVLHREPIEVTDWLEQVMRLFTATPPATRVTADLTVAAGTPMLSGDTALLTQVMLNLLKNAAEATIDVPLPRITVSASPGEQGGVKIVVTDNGPGVPDHLVQEVFLPFFTTKQTGTGIGLSFTRQIALLHGGQVGVSGSGHGRIELLLPAV